MTSDTSSPVPPINRQTYLYNINIRAPCFTAHPLWCLSFTRRKVDKHPDANINFAHFDGVQNGRRVLMEFVEKRCDKETQRTLFTGVFRRSTPVNPQPVPKREPSVACRRS